MVLSNGFQLGIIKYDLEGNGTIIARVPRHLVADAVMIANAKLIAAAPDLLAACKDALDDFNFLDREFSIGEAEGIDLSALIAAIAKAEPD